MSQCCLSQHHKVHELASPECLLSLNLDSWFGANMDIIFELRHKKGVHTAHRVSRMLISTTMIFSTVAGAESALREPAKLWTAGGSMENAHSV